MFRAGILTQQTQITASSPAPAGLFDKIVSWYDVDETGTNQRLDNHASNDLTVADGVTHTTGLINNAMLFDSNSQAQAPNNAFTGNGTFAVCAFVHPNVRNATDVLFWRCGNGATGATVPGDWDVGLQDNTGASEAYLRISDDGSYNTGGGDRVWTPTNSFPVGETHMVYAHYNSSNNEMAITHDLNTLVTATLSHTFYTAGDTIRMGRMTSSFPHGLEGWMDCIGIFDETLTLTERTWLFNSGSGRAYSELLAHKAGTVIVQSAPTTNDAGTGITLTNLGSVTATTDGFAAGRDSFVFTRLAAAGLGIDDDVRLDIGNQDFTVEAWVKTTQGTITSQSATLWANDRLAGNGSGNPRLLLCASTTSASLYNGSYQIIGTTAINDGTWHHVALCRKAGTYTLYIDGTAEGGTYADSTSYSTTGMGILDWSTNGSLDGEIALWRIAIGASLYNGSFTPPTDLL